jgi:hypothetical protein
LGFVLAASIAGCSAEPPPAPADPAPASTETGAAKTKKKARPGKEDPGSNYTEKPGGGGGK